MALAFGLLKSECPPVQGRQVRTCHSGQSFRSRSTRDIDQLLSGSNMRSAVLVGAAGGLRRMPGSSRNLVDTVVVRLVRADMVFVRVVPGGAVARAWDHPCHARQF